MDSLTCLFFFSWIIGFSFLYDANALPQPQLRASPQKLLQSSEDIQKTLALVPQKKECHEPSKVYMTFEDHVINPSFKIDTTLVAHMLSPLICGVTGKKTIKEAWRSLIKTGENGDSVGIKVATEPGLLSGTHQELVKALISQLIESGVKPEKILIWDRRRLDLERAGYFSQPNFRLEWIEHGSGYDPKAIFTSPLVGQLMYGDAEFRESPQTLKDWMSHSQEQFSNDSHYTWILTQKVDKIINVPSLCDSGYCGVNGALANMTLGCLDNWRRFTKAPHFGDPFIAQIYETGLVQHKVIMTIMDGLTLQCVGGPAPSPSHVISYGALFASFDPVAIDATAVHLINEQRQRSGFPKLDGREAHVQAAENLSLGNAAAEKIEYMRLNPSQEKPGSLGFHRVILPVK